MDVVEEEGKLTGFHFYMGGKSPLRNRMRECWRLLVGRDAELLDFYIKEGDKGKLIRFLGGVVGRDGL